jgi:hypothetical protein
MPERVPCGNPTARAARELRAIIAIAALCLLSLMRLAQSAAAQGIASSSVRGNVRNPDGVGLDGASVRLVNRATRIHRTDPGAARPVPRRWRK